MNVEVLIICAMMLFIVFFAGFLLGGLRREKRESDEQAASYELQLAERHAPKHARTKPRVTSEFNSLADD